MCVPPFFAKKASQSAGASSAPSVFEPWMRSGVAETTVAIGVESASCGAMVVVSIRGVFLSGASGMSARNSKNSVPERRIAAGKVSTQARAMFRTVEL